MTYAPRIRITSQPRAFSGALNETITMSVVAEGSGLSYRWQWRAYNTSWNDLYIDGCTNSTLTMPFTTNRRGIEYRCVITDASGNKVASEPAKVMEAPITITVQPQHVIGTVGRQYTMTVAAKGSGFTYQWQWRADSSCAWDTCPLTGSQTATMTVPCSVDRTGNQYRCVITDANGNSVASDYGELRQADNNWTFTYDANGMRTSRSNGVRTYSYVYNGGKLSKMSVPYHTMEFTYDADGKPFSMIYNGTTYYYVTNLQGDVVAIVGYAGTVVVRYTYDAWGKVLTISGGLAMTLGHLNPLRYRGCVYDHETRLYYLQSRYYDPEMGRFLNADAFASTGQSLLGNNMFAYCLNNPSCLRDSSGQFARSTYDLQQADSGNVSTESTNPRNSPPDHPDFTPPKGGNKKAKNPNGKGWGWVDSKGNVWVWEPRMHGGEGWTIQEPGGGHGHAYPGGGTRKHRMCVTPPESFITTFPAIPQESMNTTFPAIPQSSMITTFHVMPQGSASAIFPIIIAAPLIISIVGSSLYTFLESNGGVIEW